MQTFRALYVSRPLCNRGIFTTAKPISIESVGQLQVKSENAYEPGQLFLHRHFGYRGIIMQSWTAKMFDRNLFQLKATDAKSYEIKRDEGVSVNMYHVLADQRDLELCNSALKPGITFLPDDKRVFNTIYIVSGMDYAFHDDIIPYTSSDNIPIKNEYLQEFMLSVPDRETSLIPTDQLRRWIETRKQSLEVTCVHREVTEGIRITAVPFFMGRRIIRDESENHIRYWRYLIRLENMTSDRVQLRERLWKVFSITGNLESVRGKGIVGSQPILSAESPIFQYHSHVQVPVPWAHMWGSFRFERTNGSISEVKIPSFPLCDQTYWSKQDGKDQVP